MRRQGPDISITSVVSPRRTVVEKSSGIEFACKSVTKILDIPNISGASCAEIANTARQPCLRRHRRTGGIMSSPMSIGMPAPACVSAASKQAQHIANTKREIQILTRLRGTLR